MRLKTILLSVLLASQCLVAAPLSKDDETVIEVITTLSGKTYHHCRIYKVDPDGVMFFHDRGGAKVLFLDLPPEICRRLGYDPQKQASYEDDLTRKRLKRREQAIALQRACQAQIALAQLDDLRADGYAGPYAYGAEQPPVAPGNLAYAVGWPLAAGFGNIAGLGFGAGYGLNKGGHSRSSHGRGQIVTRVIDPTITVHTPVAVRIFSRGIPCSNARQFNSMSPLGRLAPPLTVASRSGGYYAHR